VGAAYAGITSLIGEADPVRHNLQPHLAARSNSKCGRACSMSGICSRASCQKRAQRSRASVRSCEPGYDVDWRAADVRFEPLADEICR
jgi:hypothetical protein